ncbi:PLP-dependent cysteine synthase family protein [bacterium]|nr:PLP-dependent cysteine synthase family protein [bacterium]
MLEIAKDITDLIGKTPLVRINKLTSKNDATIWGKLEWYNIGGSIKDRMVLYLIRYAEAEGKINKEKTILEATSGNTGIALAMIAALRGYKTTIIIPESASVERQKIIEAYGANLLFSPGEKGTAGAIELKEKMLKESPEKYVDLDQFKNPLNVLAHYQTTGKEILEQTKGRLDAVIVGIGTSGTGVGISKKLKEYNQAIKIIGVTPKKGVDIQGLRNPNEPYPTQLFKKGAFDEIIEIDKEDVPKTFKVARRMAREEGLLIGMSSGAIMWVALRKAKELGKGKTIVAVLPDNGLKYLTTPLFGLPS